MARLIENIETLKKHITISANFDFKLVLPYCKRAERKFIESQIGYNQYQAIVTHPLIEDSPLPMNRVKLLLEEAAANFGLLLAIDFIQIQIVNSGIKTTATTKSDNADWKLVRDLKRSLSSTANEAIDSAFEIMEDYPGFFLPWSESSLYTIFNSQIVAQTKDFQDSWDIQKNRKTFLALTPYMKEVETQYFLSLLGKCTLDFLKTQSSSEIVLEAQSYAKKAMVALTVAKVAITGTFIITSSSLVVMNEELPWEKTSLELSEEKLNRLHKDRQSAGEEYLKLLKKIIIANPTIFNCFEDKIESGLTDKIISKKSHLFL